MEPLHNLGGSQMHAYGTVYDPRKEAMPEASASEELAIPRLGDQQEFSAAAVFA